MSFFRKTNYEQLFCIGFMTKDLYTIKSQ
ncbi:MAG: hypothetical protein ACTSPS_09325 [Promethearchaeota archaeon]